MNKVKKGRRFEKQVAETYQKNGYTTYRPIWTKYHQKDIFGLWDGENYHPRRRELVFWAKTRREDFTKEIKENLLSFTPYIVGIDIAFSNPETGKKVDIQRIAEYRLARIYGNPNNSEGGKKIRNRSKRPRGDFASGK